MVDACLLLLPALDEDATIIDPNTITVAGKCWSERLLRRLEWIIAL